MLNEENLKTFVKNNLFETLDEFKNKLSKEFNIQKENISINLIDNETFIKINEGVKAITTIIKIEEPQNV